MAVKNYGIHDKWTNINTVNNVEIQSVDGVIENIKVNGEPAGGGGSTTAKVTVIGKALTQFFGNVNGGSIAALLKENEEYYNVKDYGEVKVGDTVHEILLINPYDSLPNFFFTVSSKQTVTASGNCTVEQFSNTEYEVVFTGDCTITIS